MRIIKWHVPAFLGEIEVDDNMEDWEIDELVQEEADYYLENQVGVDWHEEE